MVQTSEPESDLMQTLRRGNPIPYLERVLVERGRMGLPPATETIAVEVRGKIPAGTAEQLADIEDATVTGPIEIEDGVRWLLQGDLRAARRSLRHLAGRWRSGGATLRIDVDPIDL